MSDLKGQLSNLTSAVAIIEGKLKESLEFVQNAPDIAKLPKDVEGLKKVVAELGSKQSTDDKEVKITSEKQAQQNVKLNAMDGRLSALEGNISDVAAKTNSKFAASVSDLQNDMQKLNSVIANVSNLMDGLAKHQKDIDAWKAEIEALIAKLESQKAKEFPEVKEQSHAVKKVLERNSSISEHPM